jgi:hypothetical protein
MTSTVPRRRWRPSDLLPMPQEALGESLRALPSWFLRIECERCGKVRSSTRRTPPPSSAARRGAISWIARREGCGGRAAKAELLTCIVNSHPVCWIVPMAGHTWSQLRASSSPPSRYWSSFGCGSTVHCG